MLIGKDGKALKEIYQKTNCYIFVSDKLKEDTFERMLQFSGGSGPAPHAPPGENDEFNSLPPIEKCKHEITQRLKKLEQFAVQNNQPLSTETVLKFLDQEEKQREKEPANEDTWDEGNKKSLLQLAINQEQGYLGAVTVKQEMKGEVDKIMQFVMTTQESQKDFLFDPYAAAYYERFQGFVPGEKTIDFKQLKWPAMQENDRYTQSLHGKTFLKEYHDVYGEDEARPNLSNLQEESTMQSELIVPSKATNIFEKLSAMQ